MSLCLIYRYLAQAIGLCLTKRGHPSALDKSQKVKLIAEPHSSWADAIRNAWYERYGVRY